MEKITEIAQKIQKIGGRLYLVGGAVRDEIMGRKIEDEDYCIVGISQKEFEELFPEATLKGKSFPVYEIDKKEIALARTEKKIGIGHKGFEIETNKKITIEEDLKRRDITINSIAKDVLKNEYIDPFDGILDIKNKIIRMTSNAFGEDPLRVYRVARFSSMFQFQVEDKTTQKMHLLKEELFTLPKERVFQEFKKALASDKPSTFFEVLRKADLLDVHFKEIYDLIGKIQPEKYHPEGDSYQHTMISLDASCLLTNDLKIRFSCLVHDLGKGTTPIEVLPHHYGHEKRGEELVSKLGSRIGIPKIWEECGKTAAKEHMRGGMFSVMTPKKQVDFIENVSKSPLRLSGMKIVVLCDQYRNGKYPENINFDIIGEECLEAVKGKNILQKNPSLSGKKVGELLHKERIEWIKKRM